jgi:hypothetical protein
MPKRLLPVALCALATSVYAHPGHGALTEWHWHASDTGGFLVVALLAGLAVWLARKD